MNEIIVILLRIVIIIIAILLISSIYKISRSIKRDKRISKYSFNKLETSDESFIDLFIKAIWYLINKISNSFNNSYFLKSCGDEYNIYLPYSNNASSGTDYIVIKSFLAIIFMLLSFILISFSSNVYLLSIVIIAFILGFTLPDIYLNIKYKYNKKIIEEDLLKAIIIMNSSFKSGSNITKSIEIVKDNLNGPISIEFKKILEDIKYGLSIEKSFNRFYERIKIEDAKYIVTSLILVNATGGNIVSIFKNIETNIYNKRKLQNELKSMTSASILVYRLLLIIPIVLITSIFLLNPLYFKPLYTTGIGIVISVIIFLLYIIYFITIRKIMKVEV